MADWQRSINEAEADVRHPTHLLLPDETSKHPEPISRGLFYARKTWREAVHMPRRALVRSVFNYPPHNLPLRSTAWLDGLRGLAALEVYLFHYCDGWIDRTLHWGDGYHGRRRWYYFPLVRTFWTAGDASVCLFFLISGYVLSRGLLAQMRRGQPDEMLTRLSSAAIRRAIRLYTPVLVLTFMLMILARLGLPKALIYDDQPSWISELGMWAWSFNWLQLPLWRACFFEYGMNRYDGGISWTIPMEYDGSLHIYMSILFLCRFTNIRLRRALSLLWVVMRFCRQDWSAGLFIIGMTFADWHLELESTQKTQELKGARPVLRQFGLFVIFVIGLYCSGLPPSFLDAENGGLEYREYYSWLTDPFYKPGRDGYGPERYIACAGALCLFIAFSEMPRLKALTESRPVQYLGRISFGLYLCHIFVRAWLAPWKVICLSTFGVDPNDQLASPRPRQFGAYVMFMIPATAIVFIVGGIFQRTLDKQSIALGKWFEQKCLSYNPTESTAPRPLEDRRQ